MITRRHTRTVLLCAVLAPAAAAPAASKYYIGGDGGAWGSNANWSNTAGGAASTAPAAGDDVFIPATTSSKTVVYNGPSYATPLNSVTLNGTSSFVAGLNLNSSSNFASLTETVGDTGRATLTQNAGVNAVSSFLNIGFATSSLGTYLLSSTATLTAANVYVGFSGNGSFSQTGGSVSTTNLTLAYNPNSVGNYSLTGGSLTVTNNFLLADDANANATFSQSAGSVTINNLYFAGGATSSKGTYLLSGGTLIASYETLSNGGAATFTQTAGSHTVTGTLSISSSSTYAYNGGTLSATSLYLGPNGSLKLAADPANFHYGIFNQSGGAVTSTGAFSVNGGSYNPSAGTLAADSLQVATTSPGAVNHSGGTLTVNSLDFGSAAGNFASYILSGSATLSVAGASNLAGGTFQHNNGSFSTASLNLAPAPNTAATYNLVAGSLSVNNNTNVGSPTLPTPATFTQTGGTLTTSFVNVNPTSSYTLNGPTALLTAAGVNNAGSFTFSAGTLNAYVTNTGTFSYTSTAAVLADSFENRGTLLASAPFVTPNLFLNYAPLTLPTGASVSSTATGNSFFNYNYITLAGGSLTGPAGIVNYGSITGTGVINGTGGLSNYGTLAPANGPLTLSNAGTNTNYATLAATPNQPFIITTNLTNAGTLDLAAGILSGKGAVTNSPAGLLTGPGTLLNTSFSNAGTLLAPAGTTRINPSFSNTGTLQLNDTLANLTGGSISSTGTIQGVGKISNPINNAGTIEPLSSTLTLAGPLTNTGLLTASANAKLLITGPFPSNAGTIALNGGTLDTNNQPLANNNLITGFGTLRTSSLTNNASIILTGGPSTLTGPVTNTAGHTIEARFNPVLFTGLVTNSGTIKITSANVTFAGTLVGNAPSEPTGVVSSLTMSSSPQSPGLSTNNDGGLSGPGTLILDPTSTLVTSYLRQSSLVMTNATLLTRPSAAGGQASYLSSFTLLGSAQLDLADNNLILDYPDTAAATPTTTALRTYLLNRNITSSLADADPQHHLAIGYLTSAQLNTPTWGSLPVDDTSLLTKLTSYGDANLDGKVNADDYALLDKGYATHGSTWSQGDFNYDGTINSQDYLLIDKTFLIQSQGPETLALLAQRESQFGPTYVSTLLASLPEPSLLSSVFCLLPSLPRPRRQNRSPH